MEKEIADYFRYVDKYGSNSELEVCASEPQERGKTKKNDSKALLDSAFSAWGNLAQLRAERKRNIEYKNGNQWSDIVDDPDHRGKKIREAELIARQGKSPLKHNFIQQFIRNLSGQMLSNPSQSVVYARTEDDTDLGEMLTNTLQSCHHINQVARLDLSLLEELILSGTGCYKVRYEYCDTKKRGDGKLEVIPGNRIFYNSGFSDVSMSSLSVIGEIHDYTIDEVVRYFAKNQDDERLINKIYSPTSTSQSLFDSRDDFHSSIDSTKCRVIEIWHKRGRWETSVHDYLKGTVTRNDKATEREIERINKVRISEVLKLGRATEETPLIHLDRKYVHYWSVSFITPTGEVLMERETPYAHGSHPYVLTSLPSMDGCPRGVVNDLIDIQRYINRLIVMIDFIIGASAKGVLMVPENAIPDGCSVDDFTSEYVKANGVIVYKPNNTRDVPFQISSNSTNVGAWEMLSMQMGLIKEISGISGAIQGYTPNSNTPSSLYAQQAQNSQLNYKVLFDTLRHTQRERDEKLIKVLMQYYKRERYVNISGVTFGKTATLYQPKMAAQILDFNLVVSQATSTPLYRQINDDILKNMLDGGHIDVEMFLSNSSLPFAETLLSQLKAKKTS